MCHKKHIKKIYTFTQGGRRGEIRIYVVGEHYSFHGCQQCENNNTPVNTPGVLLQEVHNIDIMDMCQKQIFNKSVKGLIELNKSHWPDLVHFFQTLLKYSFVLVSK